MKDLIAGSLGRLDDAGGSKMYTTPRTVYVPPEYEIETDVPSVAEFVTCSLDGRLWIWKRSRRYYVAVFRWNDETQRLEFVSTTILSGEIVIRRGVDWILTDKSFFLTSDDEPYFTRTEYASDDTSYIDAVNKCYSFVPELETWQEINNQKIRVENSPNDMWQEIPQSKLTPLEIHYYSDDDIQAVTDFKVQIICHNGQLYGKGKAHIGRIYLLPQTFSAEDNVEDFYLYVSPDYLRAYDEKNLAFDDNDGWNELFLAPLDANSVAVFMPQDNDSYVFGKKAKNALVYILPQCRQLDFSNDNGSIFFDVQTCSNLILNNAGINYLDKGISYECKGITQWVSVLGYLKSFSDKHIISSCDDATIVTNIKQGFFRNALSDTKITLIKYNSQWLLCAISKNNIKVYGTFDSSMYEKLPKYSVYDSIFRDVIQIYLKNYLSDVYNFVESYTYKFPNNIEEYDAVYWTIWASSGGLSWYKEIYPYPMWCVIYKEAYYTIGEWSSRLPSYYCSQVFLFYLYPDTGEIKVKTSPFYMGDYITNEYDANVIDMVAKGNKVGLIIRQYKRHGVRYDNFLSGQDFFVPVFDIPEDVIDWSCDLEGVFPSVRMDVSGLLKEYYSKILFKVKPVSSVQTYNNTWVNTKSLSMGTYTKAIHLSRRGQVARIYFTELHPEIFDFKSEVERSKLT